MNKADQLLAQVTLLERMLHGKVNEFADEVKITNPKLANLIRNDILTINRSHQYFYKFLVPHIGMPILDDYEKLEKIISDFFEQED